MVQLGCASSWAAVWGLSGRHVEAEAGSSFPQALLVLLQHAPSGRAVLLPWHGWLSVRSACEEFLGSKAWCGLTVDCLTLAVTLLCSDWLLGPEVYQQQFLGWKPERTFPASGAEGNGCSCPPCGGETIEGSGQLAEVKSPCRPHLPAVQSVTHDTQAQPSHVSLPALPLMLPVGQFRSTWAFSPSASSPVFSSRPWVPSGVLPVPYPAWAAFPSSVPVMLAWEAAVSAANFNFLCLLMQLLSCDGVIRCPAGCGCIISMLPSFLTGRGLTTSA